MADILQDGASFRAAVGVRWVAPAHYGHADMRADVELRDGSGVLKHVVVSNVRVIKNRPLDSRWRDNDYPATFVPFYLFGAHGRYFVDHALVKAPNAQLTAEVFLSTPLTDAQLARGLLLGVARPEVAMQPADAASTAWFAPEKTYGVTVFDDPNGARAHGPGLVSAIAGGGVPLATGTMTVTRHAYVDVDRLNTQEFTGRPTHRITSFTSRDVPAQTKQEWRRLVQAAVGHRHGSRA